MSASATLIWAAETAAVERKNNTPAGRYEKYHTRRALFCL